MKPEKTEQSEEFWLKANEMLDGLSKLELQTFIVMCRTRLSLINNPWWAAYSIDDLKLWLERKEMLSQTQGIEYICAKRYYEENKDSM